MSGHYRHVAGSGFAGCGRASTQRLPHDVQLTAEQYGFVGKIVQIFASNGTESHPNAGLLVGNGYSYTSANDSYCQSHTATVETAAL